MVLANQNCYFICYDNHLQHKVGNELKDVPKLMLFRLSAPVFRLVDVLLRSLLW